MQTDTNPGSLVFGNIDIIITIAERMPHIIPNEHCCSCKYCSKDWEIEDYQCSECNNIEDYIDDFRKNGKLICPKCWIELLSEEEYKRNIQCKKNAYVKQSKTKLLAH